MLICVDDPQFTPRGDDNNGENDGVSGSCFGELWAAFKGLKRPMWLLMVVTAINWVAWFPYMLFDTDWMGREVYGGKVGEKAYDSGVHKGALGLMLNSVVLALMSLTVEPLGRFVGGVKWLWGIVNVILAVCMAMTVVITRAAEHERKNGVSAVGHPSVGVQVAALTFFSVLGVPLAVRFFLISYHACIWKLHFFFIDV